MTRLAVGTVLGASCMAGVWLILPVLCPAWPDHNPGNKRARTSSLRKACAWLAPPVLKVPLMGGLMVEPGGPMAPAPASTASTSTASARRVSRINPLSGLAGKFAEAGPAGLGECGVNGLDWLGLIRFCLILYAACLMPDLVQSDPVLDLPGAWPVQLRARGLILYLACLVPGLFNSECVA